MAGKPGQYSEKATELPERYAPDFMDGLDGRTAVARELRQRLAALTADLGGDEALSYQQRALCRRVIWLEARIESMEAAAARGQVTSLTEYVVAVNALSGLLSKLGFSRRAKDVSLKSYISNKK